MKRKGLLIMTFIASILIIFSGMTLASTGVDVVFNETDLGGGLWKYDYSLTNTSNNNEYLYSFRLNFSGFFTITSPTLPAGWTGSWGTVSPTIFVETHTSSAFNDLIAGGTQSGFSFTVNSQIGDVPFTAYFDDHSGGRSSLSGNTVPVVPEPLSLILFVAGGLMLGTRVYLKRKKVRIHS